MVPLLARLAVVGWFAGSLEPLGPAAGISHRLEHSPTPQKHLIETMPGGVALLDYDNDGRLDLYFVNGAEQPSLRKTGPRFWNRLYRNLGDGRFHDVTEAAGVAGTGFAMGAAAADYDNDGDPDLFVAGVTRNQLLRNRGDGAFEEVPIPPSGGWAVTGGWFDADNDGDLDLFIVNYLQWNPMTEPFCGDLMERRYRTYCHPKEYPGLPNQLFRNNGDGSFTDVSHESGIGAHVGKGMGLAFGDADGDGLIDVFVTNDAVPNFLFRNEGRGRFREISAAAGVALNDDGRALSSMGVDFRDLDNDGRDDVVISALANETFPFFRNLGKGLFEDRTYPSRIGALTLPYSGWGAGAYDFNNDGRKDLFFAGGDVQTNTEVFSSRKSRLPNLLLLQGPGGTFSLKTIGAPALHRGAAFGDLNNDGLIDAVVSRLGETPLLFMNNDAGGSHWLGLRLRGRRSNRDGLGALVRIVGSSGLAQWNRASTAGSYNSSNSPAVHFGLGADSSVNDLEVRWPSGAVQRVAVAAVDRYITVEEPAQ